MAFFGTLLLTTLSLGLTAYRIVESLNDPKLGPALIVFTVILLLMTWGGTLYKVFITIDVPKNEYQLYQTLYAAYLQKKAALENLAKEVIDQPEPIDEDLDAAFGLYDRQATAIYQESLAPVRQALQARTDLMTHSQEAKTAIEMFLKRCMGSVRVAIVKIVRRFRQDPSTLITDNDIREIFKLYLPDPINFKELVTDSLKFDFDIITLEDVRLKNLSAEVANVRAALADETPEGIEMRRQQLEQEELLKEQLEKERQAEEEKILETEVQLIAEKMSFSDDLLLKGDNEETE